MINAKFLFFASNSSRETFLCGTVFFASLERTMVVEVFLHRWFTQFPVMSHYTHYDISSGCFFWHNSDSCLDYNFLQFHYFSGLVGFYAIYTGSSGWRVLFMHAPALLFHTQIVCTYGDLNASNDIDWSPFKKSRWYLSIQSSFDTWDCTCPDIFCRKLFPRPETAVKLIQVVIGHWCHYSTLRRTRRRKKMVERSGGGGGYSEVCSALDFGWKIARACAHCWYRSLHTQGSGKEGPSIFWLAPINIPVIT